MPVDLVFTPPRRAKPPRHLVDLEPAQWRDAVAELGEKPYRAEQLARAYFTGSGTQTLPEASRTSLVEGLLPQLLTPVREISCDDGATVKTLWRAHDGTLIESVTMAYPDRVTVCVSSQAGCGMACPFCATGQAGLTRNLSAGEIVDQVVRAVESVRSGSLGNPDARVTNVVFMGMGEPLANPKRVLTAVGRLIDDSPRGLGLSRRRVVVSTVGVVPGIEALAASGLDVTLALSLHAPDDELRDTLVPVNTRWPVREVLATALDYAARSNTRLSIEYALIRDVNDQPFRADLLAKLLRGKDVHVNLIPLNPTPGSQWDASPKPAEEEFVRRLRDGGVVTTVRDTRGREIAGACGQLAAQG